MEKGRAQWIDGVRGAAIILVVLGHTDMEPNPLCKWISPFHMPVFFVLSGVLIAMRGAYGERPLLHVLAHRAKQLLYPYLTFSLLIAAYAFLSGGADGAAKVLWYTVTLEGYNAMWFLPAMWMAECMLLVLLRSRVADWLGTAVILLGTTAYAALQYYALGGGNPVDAGMLYQILNGFCRAGVGFVFMMAGYQGYRAAGRFAAMGRGRAALCALACFALGFACSRVNGMTDLHYSVQHHPALYYLAALLQTGGLIVLGACLLRRCAALGFFGRNSLIIMATHYALPVLAAAHRLGAYVSTGMRYADDLIVCAIAMLMETAIILAIRRFAPFMLRMPARGGRRDA